MGQKGNCWHPCLTTPHMTLESPSFKPLLVCPKRRGASVRWGSEPRGSSVGWAQEPCLSLLVAQDLAAAGPFPILLTS